MDLIYEQVSHLDGRLGAGIEDAGLAVWAERLAVRASALGRQARRRQVGRNGEAQLLAAAVVGDARVAAYHVLRWVQINSQSVSFVLPSCLIVCSPR